MTYLLYPIAKEVDVREACNPMAGAEGVGPLLLGTPAESTDGRYCHCHPLSDAEVDWLEARVSGITGAVVLDARPADWQAKGGE